MLQRVLEARRSLAGLLGATPEEQAELEASKLVVVTPGADVAAVRCASFRLEPGRAVGIAGPSAWGKSTLSTALVGVWPPAG